ncbi:MAG: SIS domain-containing protein [Cyanobacteria bacterium P01_E01_bin.42]
MYSAIASNFSSNYFNQLAQLHRDIQVSDREGGILSMTEGIDWVARKLKQLKQRHRKAIFIGNGGSASVASHQAVDYWRNGDIPAIAFNDDALLTCVSNDFGYEQVFSKPIATFAREDDILFAISSSGQSQNILAGAHQALKMGCKVITLSAFQTQNPLRELGDINFYVPTMSYGFAEISHLCICHCIVDGLIQGDLPNLEEKEHGVEILNLDRHINFNHPEIEAS